jgi:hypothetical protein
MALRAIAHVVAPAGSVVAAIVVIVSVKLVLKVRMTLLKMLNSMRATPQLQ